MSILKIETARVFEPLLAPARYKGAHGGRGSGKSQFFGGLAVEDALRFPGDYGAGLQMVCVREVQKSLKDSAKKLIENKIADHGLGEADGFKVWSDRIETPKDGQIIFQGMQDHTAESIKSLEGFDRAWVEEAQTLKALSLRMLRPTIRKDYVDGTKSEIWFSWNPRRKSDPVEFLRASPPSAIVVQANWRDNPWFPEALKIEREDDLTNNPDQYGHIWEGEFISVADGAYFAKALASARGEGRIGKIAADPLMKKRAYWDIGGTGAKADACAIWIAQLIGREIRVVDHYEAQGQPLEAHVNWLRDNGHERAHCVLPHDGETNDRVFDVSYESALKRAGFGVTVVPNQGKGAAMKRVECARRVFPNIYINEPRCQHGLEALGWYHEKRDEARGMGLGPEHDWSSDSADAFGLMCIDMERDMKSTGIRRSGRRRETAGGML